MEFATSWEIIQHTMAAPDKKTNTPIPNNPENKSPGIEGSNAHPTRAALSPKELAAGKRSHLPEHIDLADPFSYWFQCNVAD